MRRAARWLLAAVGVMMVSAGLPLAGAGAQASGDWPTYLDNGARTGFNGAEAIITPTTAPSLTLRWADHAGGPVSAEPVVADGVVYYGSFDGHEYAVDAATGNPIWQSPPYLGQSTTGANCNSPLTVGVASTATVGTITVNGTPTQAVFVGGGDGNFYALDASTGAVIWKTQLGTPPSFYLWSSPVLYNGSLYEGFASLQDCPLVRGGIVQIDAASGMPLHTLYTAPTGCIGATVWGSPTVDAATGDIYFATGNPGRCTSPEPLAYSMIKTDSSLNILSSWRVPSPQLPQRDDDFGSTPTLFRATINGVVHQMVGLENKNGYYYAFDRSTISSGPLWQKRMGAAGTAPEKGSGNISPSAYDGNNLFIGSEDSKINGVSCAGSIRKVRPSTGATLWARCLQSGPVIGAVTMVPGVTFVCAGNTVYAINSDTKATLWSYQDTTTPSSSSFWGPATISNGQVYIGNQDGSLYAFGT